jgi:hypothetical protein
MVSRLQNRGRRGIRLLGDVLAPNATDYKVVLRSGARLIVVIMGVTRQARVA